MRLSLTIFALFIISQGFSQTLEEKLRDEICECLKEQFTPELENLYCFAPLLKEYEDEIIEFLSEDSYGQYTYPGDFIEDLYFENQQYYFESCGQYFETVKRAHDSSVTLTIGSFKPDEIAKLNEYIEKYEFNSVFVFERGIKYLQLNVYDLARKDFERLIKDDPADNRALFLKAICLEKEGKYKAASRIYNRLFTDTGIRRYKLTAELMRFMAKQD